MFKKTFIMLMLATCLIAAQSQNNKKWKLSGRLNMYLQNINKTDTANSSNEGITNNEELYLKFYGPLRKGKAGIETRIRSTNDNNIQKKSSELLYFHSYYRDKIWALEAGDVALSLNPYIFSGGAKGVKATYKSSKKRDKFDYSFITGIKKQYWRELFTNHKNETPDEYIGAFEVKYTHKSAQNIALAISSLKDEKSDINSTYQSKEGYAVGLSGNWRFNRYITVKGRSAISHGTKDSKDVSKSTHGAFYIKLLTRPVLRSVKSNFSYQRVDSNFVSFGGHADDDKEQIENTTTWKINKRLRAKLSLKANRDNLNGALGETQKLHYEALTLSYRPKTIKGARITLNGSNKGISGRETSSFTRTGGADVIIRKKGGIRYGGGYNYNKFIDKVTESSSRTTHIFKVLFGYRHMLSKERYWSFSVNPGYNYIMHHENKWSLKLNTVYKHSKRVSMDLLYLSYKTNYNEPTTNNTQNDTYQARLSYKLDSKGKNVLKFLLEKRYIDVENSADNSYSQFKGKVSLVMRF